MSTVLKFRPIPETASLRVTNLLTDAALAAMNSKQPLSAIDRACAAMAQTSALMDALAADTQDMIDRCRAASITHEALIERLTFQLSIKRATARMLHEGSGDTANDQ
jgi:hypothetical protein